MVNSIVAWHCLAFHGPGIAALPPLRPMPRFAPGTAHVWVGVGGGGGQGCV